MHRIDTPNRAPDLFGAGKDGFRDGNKALGIDATPFSAAWCNDVQENISRLIEAAGIALSKGDGTQLLTAVLAIVSAGAVKVPVRATTTAAIAALAGGAPSALDGVALAANDRILVKDQADASQNGLYVVTTLGAGANGTWSRAADADASGELIAGMLVTVAEGTLFADSVWELTTNSAIVIGTSAIAFARKDAGVITGQNNTFTKAQRGAVSALVDGATITADFAAANNFSVTLGGNRTLANPTNLVAGQSGVITITQDGAGSRTLAYGSYWKFSNGTPSLTTTAGAIDNLAYYVESPTRIWANLSKAVQ